jgi:hypothetical protein
MCIVMSVDNVRFFLEQSEEDVGDNPIDEPSWKTGQANRKCRTSDDSDSLILFDPSSISAREDCDFVSAPLKGLG